MILNLLKLEKHLTMSENIIICRMVSLIGSRFRCKFDAFDSTLYCYSDPIAENRPNALKKHQNSQRKHIVLSGDYSPKTA